MDWLWTLSALSAALVAAWAFRPALRWSRRFRTLAWLAASLIVALTPGLVTTAAQPQRLVATLFAVTLLLKLYDLTQQAHVARDWRPAAYALYVVSWCWLVLPPKPAEVPRSRDLSRLSLLLPAGLFMLGGCVVVFSRDWSGIPFLVEHGVKVVVLVYTVVALTNSAASVWRLCGGTALDPMLNPPGAATPADFWRRWNQPVHQFLQEYAFRRSGGVRHPLRGILVTFAVSALIHEYVFSMAAGWVQGYQLLFFAVQGLATAATIRIRPRRGAALLSMGGTIVFNLLTSLLFFQSINAVLPFYSSRTPTPVAMVWGGLAPGLKSDGRGAQQHGHPTTHPADYGLANRGEIDHDD